MKNSEFIEELLPMQPKEVVAYKCPYCHDIKTTEFAAERCIEEHLLDKVINDMWDDGATLQQIDDQFGVFNGCLTEEQKTVTKDSCFVIEYLALCDKPAYRIVHIGSHWGAITVGGKGSYLGYYEHDVNMLYIKDPHPLSELFVYEFGK